MHSNFENFNLLHYGHMHPLNALIFLVINFECVNGGRYLPVIGAR